MTNEPTRPKVIKSVKHTFTEPERNEIGGNLARAIANLRGITAEFDQVKASYKAKTAEGEARIDSLSTNLMNGFEMRNEPCVVVFRPGDRLKDFYLATEFEAAGKDAPNGCKIVLTEEMMREDFQMELVQAEAKFDSREEIQLFQPTEKDNGVLVVGRFGGKWFTALRVTIGNLNLNERLDSEQKCFKVRGDAVRQAIKRVKEWAKEHLKDLAKGFEQSFDAVVESQKDLVESAGLKPGSRMTAGKAE